MQAIKALVFGMALLIVAGMALLVYGLTAKVDDVAGGPAAFGTVRAALPAGATVAETAVDGDTLVIRLSLPNGGATVMVFRLSDGRQLGAVELQPAP